MNPAQIRLIRGPLNGTVHELPDADIPERIGIVVEQNGTTVRAWYKVVEGEKENTATYSHYDEWEYEQD